MKKYRILSLDGGGIRGLITAIWLAELEDQLGKPLRDHFDLIAGTSTGSILAVAISLGIPAADIVTLYQRKGRKIFPNAASRLWWRVTRVIADGPSAPKYDPEGLEEALQDVFGPTKKLKALQVPTLIFSYNVTQRTPVVFKSYKPEHTDVPVWQAVRASCSAPTYFPAMVMKLEGAANQPLVDGGVVANNPSACAVVEGMKLNNLRPPAKQCQLADFVLASFGTGATTRPISYKDAKEWGALEWAIPIIDVLFDGSTDASDYVAQQIISEKHYFRFQVTLDSAYDDMDRADEVNLAALEATARTYLEKDGEKKMKGLRTKL